jgi:hypothetical protein
MPLPRCGVWRAPLQGSGPEFVAPHSESLEIVNSWLEHYGIPSFVLTHNGKTVIPKGVLLTRANALLDASCQLYRHVHSQDTIALTLGHPLPAALHGHVRTVVPTTASLLYPRNHGRHAQSLCWGSSGAGKSESGRFCRAALHRLYGTHYDGSVCGRDGEI